VKYTVVPATIKHCAELALTMRQADVEELSDLGHEPLDALEQSVAFSRESYAGLVDGRVICLFGVAPKGVLSDEGFPWLLASDELRSVSRVFLRLNRAYMRKISRKYRWLHNYVSPRNTDAIRWLGWLGFSVSTTPQPLGPKGAMMLHFEMRA